jgi:AP-3 complex subunit sigma
MEVRCCFPSHQFRPLTLPPTVLIFNNAGKPRLTKYFTVSSLYSGTTLILQHRLPAADALPPCSQPSSPSNRAAILSRIFNLVSTRGDTLCNFVDLPTGFGFAEDGEKEETGDEDLRVIYRHYGQSMQV